MPTSTLRTYLGLRLLRSSVVGRRVYERDLVARSGDLVDLWVLARRNGQRSALACETIMSSSSAWAQAGAQEQRRTASLSALADLAQPLTGQVHVSKG